MVEHERIQASAAT